MKQKHITSVESQRIGPSHKLASRDLIMQGCYLCDNGRCCDKVLEKEHVIPKVLFSPDRPTDPITLRACSMHNKRKGNADELAARIFQLTANQGERKRYERWVDYSVSNFQQINIKPGGRLLKEIVDSLALRDITTPAGIILYEKRMSIKVDNERMSNFFINIAKGFMVLESGRFFNWQEYDFQLDNAQTIDQNNSIINNPGHPLYMAFRNRTFAREWQGICTFFGTIVKDKDSDRYAGIWGVVIYGVHATFVAVLPKEE